MTDSQHSPDTIGVIVGRDLVGDALIKLPFLRALRRAFPKALIHWITAQGPTAYAGPLREATRDLIDDIHEQPAWLPFSDAIPGPPSPAFDILIDTRNRWREARQARTMTHKVFIAPALRFLLSDRRPPLFQRKPPHLCDQLLRLVELAAGYRPPSTGALIVAPELKARARLILPEGRSYVGLAPGAGNPVKIWPRYKFEKVAMLQAAKGRVPVFILGPQELDWYDELVATIPAAKFPLQDYAGWDTDQLTIAHTLAIAGLLSAAVANDSGVGHMLAAMDCPLVTLFGPTSPDKLAPRVTRGRIIKAHDYGDTQMKAIPTEAVDKAVDELLAP
ncbi:MAG: glycosyltransferase family 9 protein [Pseudomonadota bacterium]|nr:glycosyltransferase family 9 protein [Pseudomonadota bacterium]